MENSEKLYKYTNTHTATTQIPHFLPEVSNAITSLIFPLRNMALISPLLIHEGYLYLVAKEFYAFPIKNFTYI